MSFRNVSLLSATFLVVFFISAIVLQTGCGPASDSTVAPAAPAAPVAPAAPAVPVVKDVAPEVGQALAGYKLVYDLDLAKLQANIQYDVDNSSTISGFSRIAYLMELKKAGGKKNFVCVSMDKFTDNAADIGVPVASKDVTFGDNVNNMNILSNVDSLPKGEGLTGGNIEFWPNRYSGHNVRNVPGAQTDKVFDFGDRMGPKAGGYGCMQVHNYEKKTTIFAINNWKGEAKADIGIGNNPGPYLKTGFCTANMDWTFTGNAASYAEKRLRIYVK